MSAKLFIVDDHPVFRAGLKTILMSESDFSIIGEAQSGEEILQKLKEKEPDLIVMDINMPGKDGIETTREIRKLNKNVKILLLTMFSDEAYLKEGLAAGAQGYVLKRAVDTELINAIRMVIGGEHYIYPTLIPYLYKQADEAVEALEHAKPHLSQRETEVLKLTALGYTQREISEELFVSIKTVETYKTRIMEKIGATKRSGLVKYAIKHNLISYD
ncbi:response regulator transcription factor [Mesobacillus selenatarsenatis]|uniref:Two component transcriptional regulator, LuxR family n=1 Tax=Mesobacillus selenatarsenatis (strain DSM 18680 / JCM 14380 / FERM P-15431 / SF-1) TaxID=1321606 RepID=A0A0A8WZW3_MESS1|nr:response regulator transcription factor [Mesobacillus selenatarsenatis]GAM12297.1 two component transcriptional regulator, LuxR family [Mesobacillus selenatarsenatis SF-1]